MSGKHFAVIAVAIVVFSVASVAFGQDAATVPTDASMIPDIIGAGGSPAAILAMGWLMLRNGGLTITVKLSDEDRALLKPDQHLSGEVSKLRDRVHDQANKIAGLAAIADHP